MEIRIPEFCLALMMGPTGAGKSHFAQKWFNTTEILSSDNCRALVSDDPANRECSDDAFAVLHAVLDKRLKRRRLTLVDATNLRQEDRKTLQEIAREHDCQSVIFAIDTPVKVCLERNAAREGRKSPERVVQAHCRRMRMSLRDTKKERSRVYQLKPQEAKDAVIRRVKMRIDLRDQPGPFDLIGDVHGCQEELVQLLDKLGYRDADGTFIHPEERRAVFLGDLVDRGPASDQVLETAMNMVEAGSALAVMGNHDDKLERKLKGNPVEVSHGLGRTLEQLDKRDEEFKERVKKFLHRLPEQYLLDEGRLAVAHAGILEKYQGRTSRRVRDFCLYGQTTGESDEYGLPVRQDWAREYTGETLVAYGHVAVDEARWVGNTICLDTGCVFGGSLTALRYPERELVSVPARETYYEGIKPWEKTAEEARERATERFEPGHIPLAGITGDLKIDTATHGPVEVPANRVNHALEPMSRYAVDPRWLIYLPPTISPTQTSRLPGMMEHPDEAFHQYREDGVAKVICQEKHMGSRGIVIVGRSPEVIREKFGVDSPAGGVCYTRTGRRFFPPELEKKFLDRTRQALYAAGLWDELDTGWMLLDCEIMPWSLKARGLLQQTYAPVAAAALNTLEAARESLEQAQARGMDVESALEDNGKRLDAVRGYRQAYREYCWETSEELEGVRVAPFMALAGEQGVNHRDHLWQMSVGSRLARVDPKLFQATCHVVVETGNEAQEMAALEWWQEITCRGGEGMVVKPLELLPRGSRDRIQPAVKVRGKEYLRLIYGPEYDLPGNLERMRGRNLRARRENAVKEFALGLEGIRRFTAGESPARVYQCAMGVAGLESEPGDPRL